MNTKKTFSSFNLSAFARLGVIRGLALLISALVLCVAASGQSDRVAKMVRFEFEACFDDNLWDDNYSDVTVWESGGSMELNFYFDYGYNECLDDSDDILMKPGVEYGVYFDKYDTYGEEIIVSAPLGWLLQVTEGSSSEMVVRKVYTGDDDFTMKLVPGDHWNPDRAIEPVIAAGEGSSLSSEGVIWSVGLGSLINGNSAGTLQLREGYISGLAGQRSDIRFSVTSPEIDYYAPSDILQQINAPQALVNVTNKTSNKIELKFYDWTQVTTKSGNLWNVTGSPFVTYEIYRISSTNLRITKTSGTQNWTTSLTYSSNTWTMYDWTLSGNETSNSLRKVTTAVSGTSPRYSLVKEFGRASSGGSFVQSSATRKTSANNSWEYSLTKVEKGYGTSTAVQTTDYEYYTAGSAIGMLKKVTRPSGSATRYTYEVVGEKLGLLKERFEPFKDDIDGRRTTYTYILDSSVSPAKLYVPSKIETHVRNTSGSSYSLVGKTVLTYSGGTENGNAVRTVVRDDYVNGTDVLTTTTITYNDNETGLDSYRRGMPFSVTRPDGTKTSYAYADFTTVYDFEVFHGRSTAGVENSYMLNKYFGVAEDIDDIYLVEDKSVKSQNNINLGGNVYASYESISYQSTYGLEIMAETSFSHEAGGRLILAKRQSWANNFATGSWNTMFEADYDGIELSWTKDALGVKKINGYDTMGRIDVVEEVASTDVTYNDLESKFASYLYDGSNRRIESEESGETTSEMIVSSWEYDQAGRLTKESKDCCDEIDYTYSSGGVVRSTNPDAGYVEQDFYKDGSLDDRSGTATTPLYVDTKIAAWNIEIWSASNNIAAGTFGDNGRMRAFDGIGRVKHTGSPRWGNSSYTRYQEFDYDNADTGRLEAMHVRTVLGTGGLLSAYRYEYDDLGQLEYEGYDTNSDGDIDVATDNKVLRHKNYFWQNGSNFWYGRQEEYVFPSSSEVKVSDLLTRVAPASGLVSETWEFGALGNYVNSYTQVNRTTGVVTSTVDPYPAPTNNAVSIYKNGLLVKHTDHAAVVKTYEYDHLRRLSAINGRDSVKDVTTYINGSYRPQYRKQNNGTVDVAVVEFQYGSGNRVSKMRRKNVAGDEDTDYTYNTRGQVTAVSGAGTYPMGYVYDGYGRKTEEIQYRNVGKTEWSKVKWVYDDAYNTGLISQKRHYKTTSTYDDTDFTYTALDQVARRTWDRGIYTNYGYASTTGALTSEIHSDYTDDVFYDYDKMGRLDSVEDGTGTRFFEYSSLVNSGLSLTNEYMPGFYGSEALSYAYQSNSTTDHVRGGLESYSFDGATWAYTMDKAKGRLKTVGATADGLGVKDFAITYDADSNHVFRVSYGIYKTERSYESWRENRASTNTFWGSDQRASWGTPSLDLQNPYTNYKLSDVGSSNLAEEYNPGSGDRGIVYNFTYDKKGQLATYGRSDVSTHDVDYDYDEAGNVEQFDFNGTLRNYASYNEANQSTSNSLSYDADGNLSGDADWTYTYDAYNRLIAMDGKSGNNLDLEFMYDYMSRRVQKRVFTNDSLTKEVKFLYQGMTLIAELQSDAEIDYSFHWGPDKSDVLGGAGGAEGMLYMRDWDNDGNYYPSYDMNGNLIAWLDGGGSFKAWYEYDANGRVVDSGGDKDDVFPIGWSTQYTDRETDLVYYGLRYYSPDRARFLNRDPIGEAGGSNLYRFVGNNPVSRIDIWGLYCEEQYVLVEEGDGWEDDGHTEGDIIIYTQCWDDDDDPLFPENPFEDPFFRDDPVDDFGGGSGGGSNDPTYQRNPVPWNNKNPHYVKNPDQNKGYDSTEKLKWTKLLGISVRRALKKKLDPVGSTATAGFVPGIINPMFTVDLFTGNNVTVDTVIWFEAVPSKGLAELTVAYISYGLTSDMPNGFYGDGFERAFDYGTRRSSGMGNFDFPEDMPIGEVLEYLQVERKSW